MFATICDHLRLFATFGYHLQSFATVWNHLQLFATICNSLQLFAIICGRLGSFGTMHSLRLVATICDNLRPILTICDIYHFCNICKISNFVLCTLYFSLTFVFSLLYCHIIHLIILSRFSWPSLVYMFTKTVKIAMYIIKPTLIHKVDLKNTY